LNTDFNEFKFLFDALKLTGSVMIGFGACVGGGGGGGGSDGGGRGGGGKA